MFSMPRDVYSYKLYMIYWQCLSKIKMITNIILYHLLSFVSLLFVHESSTKKLINYHNLKKYSSLLRTEDLVYDCISASMLASLIQEDRVSVLEKDREGVSSLRDLCSSSSSV